MNFAVRPAIITLSVLLLTPPIHAQIEKIQPANFAVWSPVVGSGAIYQLESNGKTQVREIVVVKKEEWGTDKSIKVGYVIESRVSDHADQKQNLFRHFFVPTGKNLTAVRMASPPDAGEASHLLYEISFTNRLYWGDRLIFNVKELPLDFRRRARRIGTEYLSTPAGKFECEVWRTNKGGETFWYSPKVSPFGLVKLVSKAGSVLLTKLISGAREQIALDPGVKITTPADQSAVLFSAFPGVWVPVVGSGAAYQFEKNGTKQDVEVAVVGFERSGSDLLNWLELRAPCTGRGLQVVDHTPGYYYSPPYSSDSEPRWEPGRTDVHNSEIPWKGSCTNKILMTGDGLVASLGRAFFSMWDADSEGNFSILDLLQVKYGPPTWHPAPTRRPKSAELNKRPPVSPESPEVIPLDFRERAVLLGSESISTPAGTFLCEHWRSETERVDVWLNAEVTPLGLVKKSSADGNIILTKVITKAKARLKENQRWKNLNLEVELRPHK